MHISRADHITAFSLCMRVVKGPRRCSVEFSAVNINKLWINSGPVLCSSSGWDSWSLSDVVNHSNSNNNWFFQVWVQTLNKQVLQIPPGPAAGRFLTRLNYCRSVLQFKKEKQQLATKQIAHFKQAGLEQALHSCLIMNSEVTWTWMCVCVCVSNAHVIQTAGCSSSHIILFV